MGSIVCDAETFCVALGAIPGPDRSASLPKGTDTTIPAATTRHRELPPLAPHRFAVWCNRSSNIRTPRLLRPRVTSRWQVSWLTGHRRRPPSREHAPFSVALLVESSPLTLAGTTAIILARPGGSVNIRGQCDRRFVGVVIDRPQLRPVQHNGMRGDELRAVHTYTRRRRHVRLS